MSITSAPEQPSGADACSQGAELTEWDGRGLPPVAQARIARAGADRVRTSMLSAADAASLGGVGFVPVGEVMGCVVEHIGWGGYGCGAYYSGMGFSGRTLIVPPTVTSGRAGLGGYGPYAKALYYGYDVALHRMLLEAQALGADGVVGVRWTQEKLDDVGNREFVALGTAVRSSCGIQPAHLFATDLGGADVAKLLHAGWVPTGLIVGISVGVRHDDYYTRAQAAPMGGRNVEVAGFTELVSWVRADARLQFAQKAARQGGDAAVVSDMSMHFWGAEVGENHRDHVAQAIVTGTSIAQFHVGAKAPTDSLVVMPLRTGTGSS